MPKRARELSATEVRRLGHAISKDGNAYNALHPVGGVAGLLLQVTPTGAKSWIYRAAVGYKTDAAGNQKTDKQGRPIPLRRNIGLGGFPDVPLADARNKARQIREKIKQGIDPLEESKAVKRALKAAQLANITFAEAMARYVDMRAKEFRNPRQAQQWTSSLTAYAVPHIGTVPVKEIGLHHIKAVLDPIWEQKTETASRVRARIENILGWCAVHGYRSAENPARWSGFLDEIYPSPEKIKDKQHFKALAIDHIPAFIADLQKRNGTAARALEFLVLTAARTNEIIGDKRINKIGVTWQEIDLEKKVWTVPAERMKSGKVHRVPLSERALAILADMGGPSEPDAMVFSHGDAIPSNNFLSAVLKRMGYAVTAHGFRSTFKDWCRERTAYADEVSELALAHVHNDATRAAYARSELIDKRRLLMNDWEQFCYYGKNRECGEVVTIKGKSA